MRWLFQQYLAQNHSWSIVGQNMARVLIAKGHEVDLYSTNGIQHFPEDLKPNLIGYADDIGTPTHPSYKVTGKTPQPGYDAVFSYTALKNFPAYLAPAHSNKFGMWAFDIGGKNVLPIGFAKAHKSATKTLAPSQFSKNVFVDSGIPADMVDVIPHGVDSKFLTGTSTFKLKTDKRFKILVNIGQVHFRKNIPGILESFGKAFTNKDDVSLICKVNAKPPKGVHEVNFYQLMDDFKRKFPNHAEVVILNHFIDDMSELYRVCNAFISLSHCEGFLIPALEALTSRKLNIVSDYGGQVDFCNPSNSLMVSGKVVKADRRLYCWEDKIDGLMFQPNTTHAAELLQLAYIKEQELLTRFDPEFTDIREKYTWEKAVDKLLSLCMQ
jgi:glycosyltransferase involved in cell wall biosynthesis